MPTLLTGEEQIAEIVTKYPNASNLFKTLRIDFCCGGRKPLRDAVSKQGLQLESVLHDLNEIVAKTEEITLDRDWTKVTYSEIIDHVLAVHHAYLYEELPLLSEFTTRILRVHGTGHPELAELHKLFHLLKMELEQHLINEEQSVFPLIKQYEKDGNVATLRKAVETIAQLEDEHTEAGELLRRMREITGDYALPPEACRTYTLSFAKLEQLESDLFQHIHLENNLMFPRLAAELLLVQS